MAAGQELQGRKRTGNRDENPFAFLVDQKVAYTILNIESDSQGDGHEML